MTEDRESRLVINFTARRQPGGKLFPVELGSADVPRLQFLLIRVAPDGVRYLRSLTCFTMKAVPALHILTRSDTAGSSRKILSLVAAGEGIYRDGFGN